MEYWIINYDMNIWKVIQNGNNMKRTRRDHNRRVIILPLTTAEEHIVVQRESKARTTLLQSIPDDHVADFHYMDDARDIWNAVKARFGGNTESKKMRKSMLKQELLEFRNGEAEGLHKGYDRMYKILSQLNQLKAKPEDEDINLKFLRALPSSWSQTGSHRSGNVIEDVLQSFVADTKLEQQLAYEDFEQIKKLDLEEMDLKWQMAMLSGGNDKQRYSSFKIKEIGKKEEDSKSLITVDTLVDWTDHDSKSDGVIAAKEFGMIAGCDSKDAIEEGAARIYNLIVRADTEEAGTAYV
nr:xylulose kinase-1 [Tanacetum cinerariifolium]